MKKMISILITLLLIASAPFALAEDTDAREIGATLTATGTASVAIVPDFATIILGVNTEDKTVAAAQAENARLADALIEALTAQGIGKEDIKTNFFGINPIYDYSMSSFGGGQNAVGYRVENSLQVTVWDLNHISAVLDAAMAAGVNQSYGLSFDSTKRAEAYDQALAAAVREGKRKAAVLADAAEEPLGALLSITEQAIGYSGGYAMPMKLDSVMDTPVMSGTLTVEASVQVTYLVP